MQFEVDKKELKDALSVIHTAISKVSMSNGGSVAGVSNQGGIYCLVTAGKGRVVLRVGNGGVFFETFLSGDSVDVKEDGRYILNASVLLSALKVRGNRFSLKAKGSRMQFQCGRAKGENITAVSPKDDDALLANIKTPEIKAHVDGDAFRSLLAHVSLNTKSDRPRVIKLSFKSKLIRLSSDDGFRGVVSEMESFKKAKGHLYLDPTVADTLRSLMCGTVKLGWDDKKLYIQCATMRALVPLSDQKAKDILALINGVEESRNKLFEFNVDSKDLLSALGDVNSMMFGGEKAVNVFVDVSEEEAVITTPSYKGVKSSLDVTECTTKSSKENRITLTTEFLSGIAMIGGTIKLTIYDKAVIVRNVGEDVSVCMFVPQVNLAVTSSR